MPISLVPTGVPSSATSLTPGRQTRAAFDVPETFMVEDGLSVSRRYLEVGKLAARDKGLSSRFHTNMHQWATGAWTLAPVQMGDFQEKTPAAPFVYVPVSFGGILQAMVAVNTLIYKIWKRNQGMGLAYHSSVSSSSDTFHQRQVPAGSAWNGVATESS